MKTVYYKQGDLVDLGHRILAAAPLNAVKFSVAQKWTNAVLVDFRPPVGGLSLRKLSQELGIPADKVKLVEVKKTRVGEIWHRWRLGKNGLITSGV